MLFQNPILLKADVRLSLQIQKHLLPHEEEYLILSWSILPVQFEP